MSAAAVAAGSACAARGPSAAVAPLPQTVHPGPPAPSTLIRIGSNENPFGPGPAARTAIAGALAEANRYPFRTFGALTDAIAANWTIPRAQVLLGSGSGQLLDAAV